MWPTSSDVLSGLHFELSLLVSYLLYSAGAAALLHVLPERHRKQVLLLASLVFLAAFFAPELSLFLLVFSLVVHGVSSGLSRAGRLRFLLAAGLLLFAFIPIGFGGAMVEMDPRGPADHARGYVAIFLLITYFKKLVYYFYELRCRRIEPGDLTDLLVYFLSLPFLMGKAPVVSYSHFHASYLSVSSASSVTSGLRTIAIATLHLVARVAFVKFVIDLRLDEVFALSAFAETRGSIFLALVLNYLAFYALRFGTEQLSVGVARLHGFAIRDNYENPLAARDYADLWRRWNVHFREMMVSMFYMPVVLRLSRANPRRRALNVSAACVVTFLCQGLFGALLYGLVHPPHGGFDGWLELGAVRLLYEAGQIPLVIGSLLLFDKRWRGGGRAIWLWIGVGIALTFFVRSLLLVLLRSANGIGGSEAFDLYGALLF